MSPASQEKKHQSLFQDMVVNIVQEAGSDVEQAIQQAAIPHWGEENLLKKLIRAPSVLQEALEVLQRYDLASIDSLGRLRFRSTVRKILLASYHQTALDSFLQANLTALNYFIERAREATALEMPLLEREIIYHQLIVREPDGLRILNEKLEEAGYFRWPGAGDLLVATARELRHQLSAKGQAWLGYFEGCLALFQRRMDWGEESFNQLLSDTDDQVLQALAGWKLGQLLVIRQKWSKAVRLFENSLKILEKRGEKTYIARVQMALAEAHSDLADRCGGFASGLEQRPGRFRRFLYVCQHMPFLILEWLVRRVSILPRLYFGTNYQDWIIERLLVVAGGWARKAERLFGETNNPVEQIEAQLALARLEHRVGRWARANLRYDNLEKNTLLRYSSYRFARLRLAQGRASHDEKKYGQASAYLREAVDIFPEFDDPASAAKANFWLGRTLLEQNALPDAVGAFLKSADFYQKAGDSLALTRTLWNLEAVLKRHDLPERMSSEIRNLLERIPERHAVTRFPDRILRLYRNLALVVSLPISFIFTNIIFIILFVLISIVETTIRHLATGFPMHIGLGFYGVLLLIFSVFVVFWVVRGIYSLIGFMIVYVFGKRLVPLEREQPVHISIDSYLVESFRTRVGRHRQAGEEATSTGSFVRKLQLSWRAIEEAFSIEYALISRPIDLFSRLYLRSSARQQVVEAVTGGYSFLENDIRKAIQPFVKDSDIRVSRFTFVERWSTLFVSLGAFVFSFVMMGIEKIMITGEINGSENPIDLPIGTLILFTTWTMLVVLPAVILWRLVFHRRYQDRTFGKEIAVIPTWLIVAAAMLTSIIAIGWPLAVLFLFE